MAKPTFSLETPIAEIMQTWPQTIPVFLDQRMICVGCHLARFDTLADAIDNYNLSANMFMRRLTEAISGLTKIHDG